jgi:hypothetical protein
MNTLESDLMKEFFKNHKNVSEEDNSWNQTTINKINNYC